MLRKYLLNFLFKTTIALNVFFLLKLLKESAQNNNLSSYIIIY